MILIAVQNRFRAKYTQARLHDQIVGWRANLLQNLSLHLAQGQLCLLWQMGGQGAGAQGEALGLGDGAQYRS